MFVLFSWPLATHFANGFIGEGWWSDSPNYLWNAVHFADAVRAGRNPFITDMLFYPWGSSLYFHSYTPVFGLIHLAIPNVILSNNLVVAFSFVFSGLFSAMLARHFIPSRAISFVCGFVFAFCPLKTAHLMAHADLMLSAMIPLSVLCTIKMFGSPGSGSLIRIHPIVSRRWTLLFCGTLGISLISHYYYTAYCLIFLLLYYFMFTFRPWLWRLSAKKIMIAAGGAIVLSTVCVLIAEHSHVPRSEFYFGADLISPFIPSMDSRFFGCGWIHAIHSHILKADPIENTVFAGYTFLVVLAAALVVWLKNRRRNPDFLFSSNEQLRILFLVCLVFIVLSMPLIHVAGIPVCALPSAFIHYIPFINNFRVSSRYLLMAMLLLPLIAGAIVMKTGPLQHNTWLRRVVTFTVLGLLIVEYLPKPYPLFLDRNVPAVIKHLTFQPEGTLLGFPYGIMDGNDQIGSFVPLQLYYQTIHHKPITGGYLARLDKALYDSVRAQPVLRYVLAIQYNNFISAPTPGECDQFIRSRNLRYILCYRVAVTEEAIAALVDCFKPWITATRHDGDYTLFTLGVDKSKDID